MIEGEQRGPYALEELEGAGVGPETYVWCRNMTEWCQAGEVADICRYFRRSLHDRMHPRLPAASEPERHDAAEGIPVRWRRMIESSGERVSVEPESGPDISEVPKSWIAESILALILCCPLTGAVALYFSLRCRQLWQGDKKAEAHKASARARLWVLITVVAGCFQAALMTKISSLS